MMGLVALRRDKGTEELALPFLDSPPFLCLSVLYKDIVNGI